MTLTQIFWKQNKESVRSRKVLLQISQLLKWKRWFGTIWGKDDPNIDPKGIYQLVVHEDSKLDPGSSPGS